MLYSELFQSHVDDERLFDIRYALNKGLVLDNERFEPEVEEFFGKRVRPFIRGRSVK